MDPINIFARIRPSLCWEKHRPTTIQYGDTVGIAPGFVDDTILRPLVNFHEFNRVFANGATNHDVFLHSLKDLCQWVADSTGSPRSPPKNALFIMYGQTSSGKTFTAIGDDRIKIKGVVHYAIEYLLHHHKGLLNLQVVESYARNESDIEIFNALSGDKVSDLKNIESQTLQSIVDWVRTQKVITRHLHLATTANAIHSSRGHVMYTLVLTSDNGIVSKLAICDLAGSDGQSALDALPTTNRCLQKLRQTETRMISDALTRAVVVLKHLREKHQSQGDDQNQSVQQSGHNTLAMLLEEFLNSENQNPDNTTSCCTKVSTLFCLSPNQPLQSLNTLRVVRQIAARKIFPERYSWTKHHIDDEERERLQQQFHRIMDEIRDEVTRINALRNLSDSLISADDGDSNESLSIDEFGVMVDGLRRSIQWKHTLDHCHDDTSVLSADHISIDQDDAAKVKQQCEVIQHLTTTLIAENQKEFGLGALVRKQKSLCEYQENLDVALNEIRCHDGSESDKRRDIIMGVVLSKEKDTLNEAVRTLTMTISQVKQQRQVTSEQSVENIERLQHVRDANHDLADEERLENWKSDLLSYQNVLISATDLMQLFAKRFLVQLDIEGELNTVTEQIRTLNSRQLAIQTLRKNVREALELERCIHESIGGRNVNHRVTSQMTFLSPNSDEQKQDGHSMQSEEWIPDGPFLERVPTDNALEQLIGDFRSDPSVSTMTLLPEHKEVSPIRTYDSFRCASSANDVILMTPRDLERMNQSGATPFRQSTGWTKMYRVSASGRVLYGELPSLVAHIEDGADIKVIVNDNCVHSFIANEVRIGKNGVVFAQNAGSKIPLPIMDETASDVTNALNQLDWGPKIVSSNGLVLCGKGNSRSDVTFFAKL